MTRSSAHTPSQEGAGDALLSRRSVDFDDLDGYRRFVNEIVGATPHS
jgi:hypothetical protein